MQPTNSASCNLMMRSEGNGRRIVCLLVGCLTSQQHASVSQGRICSDKSTCCLTEREVADQTFYPTQSQYTDTGLTSPSADPILPGVWHWSANFYKSLVWLNPEKSCHKRDSNPRSSALEVDVLTTRPTRPFGRCKSKNSRMWYITTECFLALFLSSLKSERANAQTIHCLDHTKFETNWFTSVQT